MGFQIFFKLSQLITFYSARIRLGYIYSSIKMLFKKVF